MCDPQWQDKQQDWTVCIFWTYPPSKILMRVGSLAGCLTETSFSTCSSFERSHDTTPFIFLPKLLTSTGISSGFNYTDERRSRSRRIQRKINEKLFTLPVLVFLCICIHVCKLKCYFLCLYVNCFKLLHFTSLQDIPDQTSASRPQMTQVFQSWVATWLQVCTSNQCFSSVWTSAGPAQPWC